MSKKEQVRHGFAYLLSTGVEFLVPLVTLPVFMTILTPGDYGAMALAQVYAVFMTGLANLGMSISYDRNYFQHQKDPSDAAKLFYSIILFVTLNMVLVGCATFLFRERLSSVMQIGGLSSLLMFVFVSEATNSLVQYYMIHLRNGQKAREYTVNDIIVNLLSVALSLIFVFVFKAGVVGFVAGKVIANTAILCVMQLKLVQTLPFVLDRKIFWAALKFSLPLTPRIFLGVVSGQFDKYLLGLLSNLDGVGIYNIAQKLAYGIFAFMVSIQNVFIPRTYKMMFNDGDQAGRNVGAYLTPYAYLCTGVAMLVAFFSEEFIQIFTPRQYHGIVGVIIVLSMYYAIQFIGRITAMQLLYSKKTGLISALSVLTLLANVAISIPFIIRWGAIGAAWGAFWVGAISIVASLYIGQRSFAIEWQTKRVWAIFGTFFISAVAVLILQYTDVAYTVRLMGKLLFVSVYLFLGFRCGWLGPELWSLVRSIGQKEKIAQAV